MLRSAARPQTDNWSSHSHGADAPLLEHDDSWSSDGQESSDGQDSASEWGDYTPAGGRWGRGRRYTQQELDDYEYELALDASGGCGIEVLDLVEQELRDEKVRELLAAVGASVLWPAILPAL